MNHQITAKSSSSEVINTTSSISDISHNNSITLCESKHSKRLTVKHRMQLSPVSTWGLFTWRWGPQVGEVTCLGGVKKITLLYMQSYNPAILGCTFSRLLNGR